MPIPENYSPMVSLHQPKWRKFLSLKAQRTILHDESTTTSIQTIETIPHTNVSTKESTVVDAATPVKKRKRSEAEIALRKAKKSKSKNKEGQEWKLLTEDHQNRQSQTDVEPISEEASESKGGENGQEEMDGGPESMPSASLLSTKAKEITKARKEEKLQQKQKNSKKSVTENTDSDKKAVQVLEYLEQYRAHITSGSEWKFKKQHQNWIVKHLYSYPWKSDDLVIQYLKTVQGQARERLLQDAKKFKEEKEGVYGEDVIFRAENVILALKE